MSNALIGYTGFVGSNIVDKIEFDFLYNSKNAEEMKGRSFDLVVCAGMPAVKWYANKFPNEDTNSLDRLIKCLQHVNAKKFVLISTVDVYSNPYGVTELDSPARSGLHPYGLNRLLLEDFVSYSFDDYHIMRLPGLFGPGLKKNIIYDLKNRKGIENITPNSVLQWYPISRLAKDINSIITSSINLINVSPEPTPTDELVKKLYPTICLSEPRNDAVRYDMRTIYAELFGGSGVYHLNKAEVASSLMQYISLDRFDEVRDL
ncbi:hypothetical protein C8J38_1303 [Rhizobium sp. PP-WC-2G-219]|nr:hypothetical protein C8J38_1303 [Rhizobium sp. PP-WC-2G-219]